MFDLGQVRLMKRSDEELLRLLEERGLGVPASRTKVRVHHIMSDWSSGRPLRYVLPPLSVQDKYVDALLKWKEGLKAAGTAAEVRLQRDLSPGATFDQRDALLAGQRV
jgi:hypothetical protein